MLCCFILKLETIYGSLDVINGIRFFSGFFIKQGTELNGLKSRKLTTRQEIKIRIRD